MSTADLELLRKINELGRAIDELEKCQHDAREAGRSYRAGANKLPRRWATYKELLDDAKSAADRVRDLARELQHMREVILCSGESPLAYRQCRIHHAVILEERWTENRTTGMVCPIGLHPMRSSDVIVVLRKQIGGANRAEYIGGEPA